MHFIYIFFETLYILNHLNFIFETLIQKTPKNCSEGDGITSPRSTVHAMFLARS